MWFLNTYCDIWEIGFCYSRPPPLFAKFHGCSQAERRPEAAQQAAAEPADATGAGVLLFKNLVVYFLKLCFLF